MQAFSGCSSQEILLDSVPSLLIAVAFLGAEHRFWGTRASVVATHRPSGRSSQALERGHSLWCTSLVAPQHVESSQTRDKPVSLALAGRFLFTVPPGKSATDFYMLIPYPATLLTSVLSWIEVERFGHPCLIPEFRGKVFSFSLFGMVLAVTSVLVTHFIVLRYVPLYPLSGEFLSWIDVELCQMLFFVYWDDHVLFILPFVYVVYQTVLCNKQSLCPWSKSWYMTLFI